MDDFHQFTIFCHFSKVNISESTFQKKLKKLQAFYYSHREEVYTILSKSEWVPFQNSFFWGDLTWNDPYKVSKDSNDCPGACPGGGPKGPGPPPLEIEKQKKKKKKKKKKKIIRANIKLFHLYFATFLVENVFFSASF